MENPMELLGDKIAREKAEKLAAKEAKAAAKAETKTANTSKVSDDVAAFFKQYPDAPSVLKVGDCLYLNAHKGAADEHAKRMGLEVEEVKKINL